MSKILKVRNVNDYGHYLGCADQHPLVSVIDYAEVSPIRHSLNNYSVYGLFLRDDADVDLEANTIIIKVRCSAWLPDRLAARRIMASGWRLPVGRSCSILTYSTVSRSKGVSRSILFSTIA